MRLSIISINRNNATGLGKTLKSVANQTFKEFEYIIVDGASTDNSVEVIKAHESEFVHLKWLSEPDKGIYNAMNKGLQMASGEYVQILNSGDMLASANVIERMLKALDEKGNPAILYGNMIKAFADGNFLKDRGPAGRTLTMYSFIHGTLNHDPVYIRRSLFDQFGYYREDLPITADWRWYVEAIPFGGVVPVYVDIDVTVFEMNGISETQIECREKERDEELRRILPCGVYQDYVTYHFSIEQINRLMRYPLAYKFFYVMERTLFKFEQKRNKKKQQQISM
jgi:glycosyltransferase involved in cell wall biosynthesis